MSGVKSQQACKFQRGTTIFRFNREKEMEENYFCRKFVQNSFALYLTRSEENQSSN